MRGWRSRGAPEVVVAVVVERQSRSSLEFETPPESRSPAAPPPRYVQTKKTSSTSTRPRRSTSRSSPRRRWVLTSPEQRSSLVIAATGRWGDTHPAHVFTHSLTNPLTHKPTHHLLPFSRRSSCLNARTRASPRPRPRSVSRSTGRTSFPRDLVTPCSCTSGTCTFD